MSFRPSDAADRGTLYRWRREQEQDGHQEGWYNGAATTTVQHSIWFRHALAHAQILIWEDIYGEPVGYLRIDSNGELSFYPHTLAAVPMLKAAHPFADRYGGRLKATVDEANVQASEALDQAGYTRAPVSFHVYRP